MTELCRAGLGEPGVWAGLGRAELGLTELGRAGQNQGSKAGLDWSWRGEGSVMKVLIMDC